MNKGIFSNWFRELATLIFTQAVQAFLLAIVMAIVVSAMSENSGGGNSTNYAAGMLALIALSQFGKIELLVKQIFGVTSQFGGDMASGRSGFTAAKFLALKGAKRVMNNGQKIGSGIKEMGESRREIRNIGLRQASNALNSGDENNTPQIDEDDDKKQLPRAEREKLEAEQRGNSELDGGDGATALGTSSSGLGLDSTQMGNLIAALNANTMALEQGGGNGQGGNGVSAFNEDGTTKTAQEIQKERLDKDMEAAQEKRKQAKRKLASGVAETAGAIVGGTVGGIGGAGVGMGMEGFGAGLGAGDWVGESVVKVAGSVSDHRKAVAKQNSEKAKIVEQINTQINNIAQNSGREAYNQSKELQNKNSRGRSEEQIDSKAKEHGRIAAKASADKATKKAMDAYSQAVYGRTMSENTVKNRAKDAALKVPKGIASSAKKAGRALKSDAGLTKNGRTKRTFDYNQIGKDIGKLD